MITSKSESKECSLILLRTENLVSSSLPSSSSRQFRYHHHRSCRHRFHFSRNRNSSFFSSVASTNNSRLWTIISPKQFSVSCLDKRSCLGYKWVTVELGWPWSVEGCKLFDWGVTSLVALANDSWTYTFISRSGSTDLQTTRSLLLTTLLSAVESNPTWGLKEKIQTFSFKTNKRDNGVCSAIVHSQMICILKQ